MHRSAIPFARTCSRLLGDRARRARIVRSRLSFASQGIALPSRSDGRAASWREPHGAGGPRRPAARSDGPVSRRRLAGDGWTLSDKFCWPRRRFYQAVRTYALPGGASMCPPGVPSVTPVQVAPDGAVLNQSDCRLSRPSRVGLGRRRSPGARRAEPNRLRAARDGNSRRKPRRRGRTGASLPKGGEIGPRGLRDRVQPGRDAASPCPREVGSTSVRTVWQSGALANKTYRERTIRDLPGATLKAKRRLYSVWGIC
jgi:hypothetical protein